MTTHPIQFGREAHRNGRTQSRGISPHTGSTSRTMSFGNHLAMVKGKDEGDETHAALTKQAEKWVSQTFYGQMLKEMRNSPFKDKLFSGGKDSDAFKEMFDQKLADKMAKGSGKKLVEAMVSKLEKTQGNQSASHLPHIKVKRPQTSPTLQNKLNTVAR